MPSKHTNRGNRRRGPLRKAPIATIRALSDASLREARQLGLRVKDDATPVEREVAAQTLAVYLETMRNPTRYAGLRLNAASAVRDELLGPIPRKLEIDDASRHASLVFAVAAGPPSILDTRTPRIGSPGAALVEARTLGPNPSYPGPDLPEIPRKIPEPVPPIVRKKNSKPEVSP